MVGVVFIGDMTYCPYSERYLEILEKYSIEYEVLYWNRSGTEIDRPTNFISYSLRSELKSNKFRKIKDFYRYYEWLRVELKEKKYDKLILLSTLSGFIVLPQLLKKYKRKYIFDIRDYSYENNKLYFLVEKWIIENAYFTCISSSKFRVFLPKDSEYVLTHNFSPIEINGTIKFKKKIVNDILNVVWIGSVRYLEYQKFILDSLGNDKRFRIIYHGTGPELQDYKDYISAQSYDNVFFTGKYVNVDKAKLLKDADIINNAYGKDNETAIKYAVSNKYYDGIIYGIPQIVESGSFKEKLIKENNLGISINNPNDNLADLLYEYYYSIDEVKFNETREALIKKILVEDKVFTEGVKSFLID